ncbi:hypothetical protein [Chitinophaga nivalis]|uniref:Lipoprotein n=1 Tax=Chitinophaga nivalis TaxID=2991709 RepID=A0ABT3IJ20_9BACT|nr:hypothetical protein [Chitinophaga nivalis]MCW3466367.1 hypothetical protein [Chitinophaga nivalis]MCW3483942.1 hypothetical protein [Chitinophaga nivalis]
MIRKRQKKQVFKWWLTAGILLAGCHSADTQLPVLQAPGFSLAHPADVSLQVLTASPEGDSGMLLLQQRDTLYYRFGHGIDNLAETDPELVYYPYNSDSLRHTLDTSLVDPAVIVYTNKPNADIDEFRKQNVLYKSIAGYRIKTTFPRDVRKGGITGMFVDSLRKDDGGRLQFHLYGHHLDSLSNQTLLSLFHDIRFKLP